MWASSRELGYSGAAEPPTVIEIPIFDELPSGPICVEVCYHRGRRCDPNFPALAIGDPSNIRDRPLSERLDKMTGDFLAFASHDDVDGAFGS
jgi:hypothetical protein